MGDILFDGKSSKIKKLTENNLNLFKQVGRVNNVIQKIRNNKNSLEILVLKEKISLEFSEDVDLISQKERIFKKIETLNSQINQLNNKLKNKAYLKNAPKEIVQNDKKLVKDLTVEDQKLRSIVSSIS